MENHRALPLSAPCRREPRLGLQPNNHLHTPLNTHLARANTQHQPHTQGYCLWDGDKEDGDYDSQDNDAWESGSTYWFMQAMRKELPEGCTKTTVFSSGTYYVDMKPQSEGDMTLGVYTDSSCTKESSYTYEDYQSSASSSLTASASSGAFDSWNSGMDAYKVCQPCRAYNREETQDDGDNNRGRGRTLGEEDDGQGDEEQNGYNCYDDAGYQK